jgi:hypothetical protein
VPVNRIVLVGHTLGGAVQDPGPCGEYKRIRCLATSDKNLSPSPFCDRLVLTDPDSWDNTADRGAYVVLEGPIDFATIPDDDPYLVGAQDEVRPRIAGIDGLLGADLLNRLEQVRIDYRGNTNDNVDGSTRVITRCKGGDTLCTVSARQPK